MGTLNYLGEDKKKLGEAEFSVYLADGLKQGRESVELCEKLLGEKARPSPLLALCLTHYGFFFKVSIYVFDRLIQN